MPNITNSLIANISATEDSSSNVIINRSTGNPAFDSNSAQMYEYQLLSAGANNFPLPTGIGLQIYIKNIDPAGTITVNWTPKGGAAANIVVLYPGDQIILFQKLGSTNAGITTLTLTPSAASVLCELFLGA